MLEKINITEKYRHVLTDDYRYRVDVELTDGDSMRTIEFTIKAIELKRLINLFSIIYSNRGNITNISWTRPVEEEEEL